MSLAAKLLSASGGGVDKIFSDDVFSSFVYTGNGSTQTINNGIDLAGKGGLVWIKSRVSGAKDHNLFDTARGVNKYLNTNTTTAQDRFGSASDILTSFNSSGFTLGNDATRDIGVNYSTQSYISHTFRKAPKFFDVVTYTGNGSGTNNITHALGVMPGFIVVKATSTNGNWCVAASDGAGNYKQLTLNSTGQSFVSAAQTNIANATTVNVGYMGVNFDGSANTNGATYVAYLFAHDPSADGIVQCGSFTTDASGVINSPIAAGWEAQFCLLKRVSGAEDWYQVDSARGWSHAASGTALLRPNLSAAEVPMFSTAEYFYPAANGFGGIGTFSASSTYVYMIIRRPNKPPTLGTQVYNAIARTGTGAAATVTGVGFAPDLVLTSRRALPGMGNGNAIPTFFDRLRGLFRLRSFDTTAEGAADATSITGFTMDGFSVGADNVQGDFNFSGWAFAHWFFKRAPGVFDVVCYTGTGVNRTVNHSLGVAPELMIVKRRNGVGDWIVYDKFINFASSFPVLSLNTAGERGSGFNPLSFNSTHPALSTFSVGSSGYATNDANNTYVAYLFASSPGISKCGSYVGNGTSQTINAGFTTGARFVMIKRTDSTGDWYIWDTVRGLVAGNDPHLSLNTTAAEVTTNDSLDPANAGFIVNQLAATNINVTSASYIYLAFA